MQKLTAADINRQYLDCLKEIGNEWRRSGFISVTILIEQKRHRLLSLTLYIQGDSGGICTTLGSDSMSDSKKKSSYEHGSDFERLRSYDRLKLGIEGNDY